MASGCRRMRGCISYQQPPRFRGKPRPAPASATPMQIMERKLRQRKPRRLYQRRKSIVEPTFGMIKAARGINRFRRHGLDAARHEWRLAATTHNLLKIWRLQTSS